MFVILVNAFAFADTVLNGSKVTSNAERTSIELKSKIISVKALL